MYGIKFSYNLVNIRKWKYNDQVQQLQRFD